MVMTCSTPGVSLAMFVDLVERRCRALPSEAPSGSCATTIR